MSASLVGSEMCIRDRCRYRRPGQRPGLCTAPITVLQALSLPSACAHARARACARARVRARD
eukprot:10020139-Alexandrium_andersonii.AAC.1